MSNPTPQPLKLSAEDILEMIGTGHFGAADSLILKKQCDEWPQVRPAVVEVLRELRELRKTNKRLRDEIELRNSHDDWMED